MNALYFACSDCKEYIDAGYRWAYWQLQKPNVVRLGEPASISAVLAATDYWNPPSEEQSAWLMDQILPEVRRFFLKHNDHSLLFLEEDHFCGGFGKYDGYTEVSATPDT